MNRLLPPPPADADEEDVGDVIAASEEDLSPTEEDKEPVRGDIPPFTHSTTGSIMFTFAFSHTPESKSNVHNTTTAQQTQN